MKKDIYAWRIFFGVPSSFPANAPASYLEEGDLKLMHTLHNRLSPHQGLTEKKTFLDMKIFHKFSDNMTNNTKMIKV